MRTRLLTVAALALLTGCTGEPPAPAAPTVVVTTTAPVSGAAVPGTPSAESEDPSGTLAAVGTGADWDVHIRACENPEQEPIVQTVTLGDVTGDGVADAAVARTCDASTSYFPSTVEVFDGASPARRPARVGTPLLTDVGPTDQPWATGVRIESRVVVVTAHGTGSSDSNACPKLALTYRYQLEGGAFTRLDRAAVTSPSCLATA